MSRTWTLVTVLVAVLTLLVSACTPGEPEFDEEEQARAGDREEEPTNDGDGEEAPAGEVVAATAIDIDFEEDSLEAPAGNITIELTNEGNIFHDFTIEELGDQVIAEADPGETTTGNVELDAGTYTYFCSVPGHRPAGMEGTLTVS